MRLLASAALTALSVTLPAVSAFAADIAATSKIDAVTVYRTGAQVERIVTQAIDAGAHTIVLKDVPAQAQPGSIRVEGKADANLTIGSVDTRRVSVLSDDAAAAASERRRLEEELEKLADALDQLRAEIETKESQKTLVSNLTSLPQQPQPRGGNGSANHDWSKLLDMIGTSMSDIQRDILKTRIAMRELGRRTDDIKKKLSELAAKQHQRTEVRINVEAASKLTAELVVKYQVRNASWRPHYDARLATGSTDKAAGIVLTRRAAIQQNTGEAWNEVRLALSTSQPSGQSAAPDLPPLTVDFRRPVPIAADRLRGMAESRRFAAPRSALGSAPAQPAAEADAVAVVRTAKVVGEAGGQLQQTAFQASFTVPGRVTVDNTGEAKRVKLDDQAIQPALNVRTVPRVDTSAYLYAKLDMPKTAPYLAGPISLFRDGGFVGTGFLPDLAPGAEHELGFGIDPSVEVKYHILAEKRGETGLISSSSTDQRNFRVDLQNRHARRIDVIVIDQMPVALNEEISVALLGPAAPTKRNFQDKRGVLAWQFTLEAGSKRSIGFGYTISWPAAKEISFEHGQ